MRVLGAAVAAFRLPFAAPVAGAGREREGLLLRLDGESGDHGLGEASPAPWVGGESLADARGSLARVVARAARGEDAEALARLAPELSPSAAFALDSALLDLAARAAGRSVAAALGGGEEELEVSALLGAEAPDGLAAEAAERVRAGYRCLKLKIGGGPLARERERVAAVRGATGPGVRLRLDANRAWPADEAARSLAALAPFAPEMVEEPLRDPSPAALARLRREAAVPLAVDESLRGAADLVALLDAGSVDAVVVKGARLGGIRAALTLGRRAREAGLRVVVTDSLETAVGRSAALHLAAALGGGAAVGLGGATALAGDVADGPGPRPRLAPAGPGLGIPPPLRGVRWDD